MRVIDIITSSKKVLNTTFSLYTSESNVKNKTKATKCMDILKELNSIMKLVISYLLRDFENSKLVLKNNKICELVLKANCSKSIENLLTCQARFLMKESSLLRKKIKKSLITSNGLNISISYTT